MKRIAAMLWTAAVWAAADDDPVEILARVRDKVVAHAERIPNHTCVETIVRDRYAATATTPPHSCDDLLGRRNRAAPGSLVTLSATDRLRLDVGLADGREIYSWAGAGKFDEREIDEIVPAGAIGTGPFAGTLVGLFTMRDPSFAYEGETTVEGRRMLEFSFSVSEEQSNYKVRAGKQWLLTGYTGSLLIDPARAELVRLTVRTAQLERVTNICEVDSSMEYGIVQLGGTGYLLPLVTRERFIKPDASEDENTITFSACREFRGESSIRFGGGGNEAAAPARAAQDPAARLPGGLPVAIDMTTPLSDEAAAGDLIEGLVAQPVRDRQNRVLVPTGAKVEGRLMRVETQHGKKASVTIVLRWETMEVNGAMAAVALTPDRHTVAQRLPEDTSLQRRAVTFVLPRQGEEKYAAKIFAGEHLVLREPLRTSWLTDLP